MLSRGSRRVTLDSIAAALSSKDTGKNVFQARDRVLKRSRNHRTVNTGRLAAISACLAPASCPPLRFPFAAVKPFDLGLCGTQIYLSPSACRVWGGNLFQPNWTKS